MVFSLLSLSIIFGQGKGIGSDSFGGVRRGLTEIRGEVLCSACTVDEAKQATGEVLDVYLLNKGDQKAVLHVTTVRNTATGRAGVISGRWETIVGVTNELHVRAKDQLWGQLTMKENLRKAVTIRGILHSTQAFDITEVTVEE